MQLAVARVEGHVHHVQGLEYQVADQPFLPVSIAAEYEGALAGTDQDEHFIITAG